jgi:hypothetical protein
VQNDEVGCVEVRTHYGIGARQWCMHATTMLCGNAASVLWHWCIVVQQC